MLTVSDVVGVRESGMGCLGCRVQCVYCKGFEVFGVRCRAEVSGIMSHFFHA